MLEQAIDVNLLARELLSAHELGRPVPAPPSGRQADFDSAAAYQVEREIVRLRTGQGHSIRGLKVGFANKAIWRALKLDTLVWAHMYSDTVHYAAGSRGEFELPSAVAPRIEPEIVFCWKHPVTTPGLDAETILKEHVEWLALGFELIDCPFPDWKFQPVDFVANLGLHRALIVGDPLPLEGRDLSDLAAQLATFTLNLLCNGELAEQGAGKNSLRNPALCLAELGAALLKTGQTVAPGDLVSSGTLSNSRDIAAGGLWRAEVQGLPLKPLELRLR